MKKLLTFLMVAILGVAGAYAADVTLDWADNPTAQSIQSYTIYEDLGEGNFSQVGTSVVSATTLTGVSAGTHTYVVTANNAWGESGQSNSVTTPDSPTAPSGLVITVIVP